MVPPTPRDLGLQLLDASSAYDASPVMVTADPMESMLAASVVRCRRLLRAAFTLADADQGLEAVGLLRTMIEYAITLGWALTDRDPNLRKWSIDDIRVRFLIHREVDGLTGDQVLTEATQTALEQHRRDYLDDLEGQPTALPDMKSRAHSAEVTGGYVGIKGLYPPYRIYSQTATHATPWAIELVLEQLPSGELVVMPDLGRGHHGTDVYAVGTLILGGVLTIVAGALGDDALRDQASAIAEAMPRPVPRPA